MVRKAVAAAFKEAKLGGTPLVSRIYPANAVSRGDWVMCMRGSGSPKSETYSLYFVGYTSLGSQRSVLVDRCDEQTYASYSLPQPDAVPQATLPPVAIQSGAPKTAARKSGEAKTAATTGTLGEPMSLAPR